MKKLLLILFMQWLVAYSFAQVKGTIVDENKIPAAGVAVVIQGTTNGTLTDQNGKFEITAKPGDSLYVSFLGYEVQRLSISDVNQNLSIQLVPSWIGLDDVVVMGYSNKTKLEISSAVTVLDEKKLNDTPSDNIAGLIQGKVSGVQVVDNSGAPGSGAEIRIRGVSTIKPGSAEPLYVVDGIIGGSFDPNDVASLTVLKDAGATGMYGARANKGVIVITTKSAKGGKTNYEFKASYGYNLADQGHVQMMNGSEFYNWSAEMYRDEDIHEIDKVKFYGDYPKALEKINHNWINEAFKPAPVQKYYLSASGKSDKLGYYISGTYYNEKGTFRKTGFEKLNLRANTTYDFNSKVSLKNNLNLSGSKGTSYDYMDMYYTYLGIPWDNPFNSDGTARYIDGNNAQKLGDGTGWWSRDPINPFHTINNSDHSYKGVALNYDLSLDVKILSWLSFSSSNRLSYSNSKNHNFYSPKCSGTYHNQGYIAEDEYDWYSALSTNLLKFNYEIGDHTIDGLAGVEGEEGYSESLGVSGIGLPEGFDVPSVASDKKTIAGLNSKEVFQSFISQVNYNYLGTYFLTGSYRVDATTNFPTNNRVAKFPSISASVLLNKFNFANSINGLTLFKVRASYGVTGDPDIGASRYMGLFALNTQYNNNTAAIPYQLSNPDLTWEETHQMNVGIDWEMFDRVTLNFDLYNNQTKNLIVLKAMPLSQGFESRYENAGQVDNKGFEAALSVVVVQQGDFKVTADVNFSKNSNKLSGIGAPITTTIGGVTQIYRDGGELYTFYLPKWIGVDTQTGAPLWEKVNRDADGNIVSREATTNYSEAEAQEVGSALPDYSGGMSLTIQYKNLTLYANGAYQVGNNIYNSTRIYMDNDGHEPYYNNMIMKDDWKRWERPGDVATHPSMQNSALSTETSSRFLEKGSFFKLRTVSLEYSLPKSLSDKYKLGNVSVALTANNLFTFTEFWGQDPEVTLTKQSWSMPGVCDFKYPNNRQYILSLNIKF